MLIYREIVANKGGKPLPGVSVSVLNPTTLLPVTIYDADTGILSLLQPLTTDVYGEFAFRVASGEYLVHVYGHGVDERLYRITLGDTAGSASAVQTNLDAHIADPTAAHAASAISFVQAGTGATTRDVQAKLRESVSITDFGAVTGTDSTAAIQSALDSGAKNIYVPDGTFLINGTGLTGTSNTRLYGAGKNVSVLKLNATPTNQYLISFVGQSQFSIEDLQLDYNEQDSGLGNNQVIAARSCEHFQVLRCKIKGITKLGVALNACSYFEVAHNQIEKTTATNDQNQSIVVSEFSGTSAFGFIHHNYSTNTAFDIEGSQMEISHNVIQNFKFGAGITTEASSGTHDLNIHHNNITGGSGTDVNGYHCGGIENWARTSTIANNIIIGNSGAGIDQGGANNTVVGNVCYNNGITANGPGISGRYTNSTYNSSGSIYSGNRCYDSGGAGGTQGYGYEDQETVGVNLSGITFSGNNFSGNKTGDTVFLGSGYIHFVPQSTTVNGHALSSDVTVTASDVGAPSGSGTSTGTNTGDQTTISGNAGTATALQTARAIYGNNFDGTAALTQIIASTYGGTGNGFTKFSGPTTTERTKTLRDASDTILELGGSYTPTGTWTSMTLVTPALGTPASGNLANCTFPTLNQNTTGSAAKWTTARNLAGNSVDGSADVTFANKFIVQGTADAGLSSAQFLGALGTGIVKNTTTTGVLSIAVAGDFPTLNQNTTGSAATLTTARAIYGNNFDGSAALTQIIASTYGGTGNGFTKFSGPTTSEKTFTLPNASDTIACLGQANTWTGVHRWNNDSAQIFSSATSGQPGYIEFVNQGNSGWIGRTDYVAKNSSSADKTYGQMLGVIGDNTAGNETGYYDFLTIFDGTLAERFIIRNGVYTAGASGGDKGANTINATTLYEAGTSLAAKYSAIAGSSSIVTVGTVTSGAWNGTKVAEAYGGTNQSTYTTGDILYASAANTLSKLAGNTTTNKRFLRQTGNGSASAAPVWEAILEGSASSVDPPNLTAGSASSISTITVTGAALGDYVQASFSINLAGVLLHAWVSAADTVSYLFFNSSGGTINLGSGTVKVRVWPQ